MFKLFMMLYCMCCENIFEFEFEKGALSLSLSHFQRLLYIGCFVRFTTWNKVSNAGASVRGWVSFVTYFDIIKIT